LITPGCGGRLARRQGGAKAERMNWQGNRTWNAPDNPFESDASTGNEGQINKSFLVLFFKKEHEKALLFEKRSKNFC
jgi:hypothetical protein